MQKKTLDILRVTTLNLINFACVFDGKNDLKITHDINCLTQFFKFLSGAWAALKTFRTFSAREVRSCRCLKYLRSNYHHYFLLQKS